MVVAEHLDTFLSASQFADESKVGYEKWDVHVNCILKGPAHLSESQRYAFLASVGKVVAMQHRWLIAYEKNSGGTYHKPTEIFFI